MATKPSQADISSVMNMCNCNKSEAVELLKRSGNDPKQAQRRHQMKLQFGWTSNTRSSRQTSAPTIHGIPSRPDEFKQPLRSIQDNDEYDIITPYSDREVFPERKTLVQPNVHLSDVPTLPVRPSLFGLTGNLEDATRSGTLPKGVTDDHHSPPGTAHGEFLHQSLSADMKPNDVNDSSHLTIEGDKDSPVIHRDQHVRNDGQPGDQVAVHNSNSEPESQNTHDISPSLSKTEWDFVLPEVSCVAVPRPEIGVQRFNMRDLVVILQGKADERAVENYLERYDTHIVQSHVNQEVDGFPSIFYAAATNNDRILRSWIMHGADVNAVHESSGVPLLAFAIVHSQTIEEDTTDVVATLLSTGASPLAIPEPFYKPYDQDLPEEGVSDENLHLCGSEQTVWLHSTGNRKLARNLNLTHRYNLERAARTRKPSLRQKQVAERNKAEGLLGLPYFLIGQSLAANRLLQTCINHLANRTERRKPLVLVFAGPSGHGKTELARRLGYLMSLELEKVDCTIVNREIELFGGRHPYVNAGEGTPINNFLARNSGQRCIVFMDEFEKTTKEIHQALLLPFDNGEYQDRRNLQQIDCSKTIWILATNALDKRIRDFCKLNETILFNDKEVESQTRLMKELDKGLKNDFLAQFDAPITGRISAFLPFLLFSPSEQAVIAHKYLLELGRDVRRPVNLTTGPEERLIGNVRLHIRRDASVSSQLAQDGYHPDLGARSLITAVDNVRHMLNNAYLEVDETIREADELVDCVIDIRKGSIFAEMCS